ncbi:hypothetical protein F0562_014943 [Nyssa sinensis]|uniref:Uncharacterized protein n=1 Tax=Nyssa sinensis TaxID=561372 RepID=A0A5J4ZQ29_9ASTE|nr:hypothetical protein F0562_014943 [Nyssa sinensis]
MHQLTDFGYSKKNIKEWNVQRQSVIGTANLLRSCLYHLTAIVEALESSLSRELSAVLQDLISSDFKILWWLHVICLTFGCLSRFSQWFISYDTFDNQFGTANALFLGYVKKDARFTRFETILVKVQVFPL